jgi:glycosyltransferase involved in cell wall biosynthesis
MDLSVVIASNDAARSIDRCLQHLAHACAGLQAEFIVADGSSDDTAARVEAFGKPATLIRCTADTLAPYLWAIGYRRATGRIVAFTTGHCLVSPHWASALNNALDGGATGAGGPLVIGGRTRPLDWAVYYLRYSGVMPHTLGSGRITGEIAGDNAAYVRGALDRHAASFSRGFWELDFHRLIRADGGWLAAVPAAEVAFSRSFPFMTIFRHRFAHGRHFGTSRVAGKTRSAWQIVLAAPLVPFVLAGRAAARLLGGRQAPWRFAVALPWFLVLATAWAAGEAWGAVRGNARFPAAEPASEC